MRSFAASLAVLFFLFPSVSSAGGVGADCRFNGICLHGRVKVVRNFADLTVKVVRNFSDLRVKQVRNFPDSCGEWQFVENFPDFTIQFVDNFPDITITYVKNFPGLP